MTFLFLCIQSIAITAVAQDSLPDFDLSGDWQADMRESQTLVHGLTLREIRRSTNIDWREIERRTPKQVASENQSEQQLQQERQVDDTRNLLPVANVAGMSVSQTDEYIELSFDNGEFDRFEWGEKEFPEYVIHTFWRKNKLFINADFGKVKTRQIYELLDQGSRLAVEVRVLGLGENYRRKVKRFFDKRVPKSTVIQEEL